MFSFLYSGGCDSKNNQITLNNDTELILCDGGNGYCSRRNVIGEGRIKLAKKLVQFFNFFV